MTSKIEVPRELLVVLADLNCPYDQLMAAKQRAAELLAAPLSPDHSVPVCIYWDAKAQNCMDAYPDHSGDGTGTLVFPERMENASTDAWHAGFNACLDKVKELNQ